MKSFFQTSDRGNEGRALGDSPKKSLLCFHTGSLYKLSESSLVNFLCVARTRLGTLLFLCIKNLGVRSVGCHLYILLLRCMDAFYLLNVLIIKNKHNC
jgi:hypothetical protein